MSKVPNDLFYHVGEKPPPLPTNYENDDGVLIASIAGATLVAKCYNDGDVTTGVFDVACTNNGDGTFTIDWGTGDSDFREVGTMEIHVEVTDAPKVWRMLPFSISVRAVTA